MNLYIFQTATYAQDAKVQGVYILGVGLAPFAAMRELRVISGSLAEDPSLDYNYWYVGRQEFLTTMAGRLVDKICQIAV